MDRYNIIILDDEMENAQGLARRIEVESKLFTVEKIYNDVDMFRKEFHINANRVYLFDVRLRGIQGYELAEWVYEQTGEFPYVIFITGEASQQIIDAIYAAHCIVVDLLLRGISSGRLKILETRAQRILHR